MTQKSTNQTIALSAQLIELGGSVPTEIKLLPAGMFKAKDGRPHGLPGWMMSDSSAQMILSAAQSQQDKFLIDYDHQTKYVSENGQKAPAAGWFGNLEWRPGIGLFATDVSWTSAATKAIEQKEYRYISPVISYNKDTGEVTGLQMAGLVNYPALDGLNDLAAAHFLFQLSQTTSEKPMNKDHLAALGLQEGADDAAILSAITALKEKTTETAALSAQIEALKAQAPDPAKFVPIEVVNSIQTELAALSATVKADEISKLIEPALADGRLLPSLKTWAESLGKSDIAALSNFLAAAQPIAALKGTQTGGKNIAQVLHGDDLVAACKAQWDSMPSLRSEFSTLDDFTAYKKADASGLIRTAGARGGE
jgi:phage I-like protein